MKRVWLYVPRDEWGFLLKNFNNSFGHRFVILRYGWVPWQSYHLLSTMTSFPCSEARMRTTNVYDSFLLTFRVALRATSWNHVIISCDFVVRVLTRDSLRYFWFNCYRKSNLSQRRQTNVGVSKSTKYPKLVAHALCAIPAFEKKTFLKMILQDPKTWCRFNTSA